MKHAGRVVGWRIVKVGDLEKVEIKMTNSDGLKTVFRVDPKERDQYPFGCTSKVDTTVDQGQLPFSAAAEDAEESAPASTRRGRGNGSATAAAH